MFKINIKTFLLLSSLSACSPHLIQQGNLVSEEKIAYLKLDYHTKEDVLEILGPPSSAGLMDKNTWYYIGLTGEKLAFFRPDINKELSLRLIFNNQGTLLRVHVYDPLTKEIILPNSRKTKAGGHDIGILEQVFGNFGRRYQQEKK